MIRNYILLFLLGMAIPLTSSISDMNSKNFQNRSEFLLNEVKMNYDSLSDKNILIKVRNIEEGSAMSLRYPFIDYRIVVDRSKLENFTDDEMKGLLAHELAHLESYSKMNLPFFVLHSVRYGLADYFGIGKNFQREVEIMTDVGAIEKGYGKELEAYRLKRIGLGTMEDVRYIKENYLSPEEIRDLTEEFENDNSFRN